MGKIKSRKKHAEHHYTQNSDIATTTTTATSSKSKKKIQDAVSNIADILKPSKSNKKERLKEKSRKWKEKIDNLKKAKDEEKAKSKREKTKITGDLKPLSDELTSIFTNIMSNKKIDLHKAPRQKSGPYNPFMSNVEQFQAVLSNKHFKESPLAAVKSHILLAQSISTDAPFLRFKVSRKLIQEMSLLELDRAYPPLSKAPAVESN